MEKSKIKFFIFFEFILSIIFILFICSSALASDTPELVNTLNAAFENIKDWLLALATPAAAVAVGVGDEERIRIAKKLIRGSLFSYAFILAINLILSAIKSLIN